MKPLTVLIALLCSQSFAFAQRAEVYQLEHSLRWLTEHNFPNYLLESDLNDKLRSQTEARLKEFIKLSELQIPDKIDYKPIYYFKKPKIKLPKSSSADYEIAIVSSISRGTANDQVFWKMLVTIKSGKKKFEQVAKHEIIPYSNSFHGSQLPWMTMEDFQRIYVLLLDECLGKRGKNNVAFRVGDPNLIMQKVESHIDIDKTFRLIIAGKMMEKSSSIYRITRDSSVVTDFALNSIKKEFSEEESKIGKDVARGIFTSLTNIDVSYTRESQETRLGTIFTSEGEKRKVLLLWLEEIERSTDEEEGTSTRIISPITGQYYNQDTLAATFVYYEEYFPTGSRMDYSSAAEDYMEARAVYRIVGEYGDQPFEVLYREFEKIVLISTNHEYRAVIPMINENPNSRKDKVKMKEEAISNKKSQNLFQALNVDESAAECIPYIQLEK